MSFKMIVTDLDQTLLRTDKSISDYTAGVFNRCREQGIKVVFATSRYMKQVKAFTGKIPADAVVALNGSVIYVDDMIVAEHTIPENIKHRILYELNAAGVKIAAESSEFVYTNRHAPGNEKIAWDFNNEVPAVINRISVRHNDLDLVMRIAGKYEELRVYANSGEDLYDIDPAETGKSKGITVLSELFGITMSETVSFGDNFNDIEMLSSCGAGVAVANACEEAKAAADYICGSNDDDGVAEWIENNVLL